jgi:hypothetical protein
VAWLLAAKSESLVFVGVLELAASSEALHHFIRAFGMLMKFWFM